MRAEETLRRISEEKPLIHHLTNYVTVNLVANTTLSVGALPVMAHAHEEVVEMVGFASALVVNIGTLDPSFVEIAAVCGNAGEIATLAGLSAEVRGVESLAGDAEVAACKAAGALGVTVAATGETDYVSDGEHTLAASNGHPLMGRVVGSGCASTALIGCFASVGGAGAETVAEALAYFGRAGEVAAKGAEGGGTFEPRLLDALAGLAENPNGLDDALRVKEVSGG
jgi:hydroxyethylthiazole kinase